MRDKENTLKKYLLTDNIMVKRILSLILFTLIVITSQSSWAQNVNDAKPDSKKKDNKKTSTSANLNGFDGTLWGTKFEDVQETFRALASSSKTEDSVEVVDAKPQKEITIRRRNITYRYLFYQKKEPDVILNKEKKQIDSQETPADATKTQVSQFFLTESKFSLLETEALYKKLQEKYGRRTSTTITEKNRGAYIWDLNEGYLIQWIEPYQGAPYTRNLYYISKKISQEIMKDLKEYRFAVELRELEAVLPK